MSAGFHFQGETTWGTNGAIEVYLGTLAAQALRRYGPEDRLTVFFENERQSFYGGFVVFLDELLVDRPVRLRFLEILDAATTAILDSDQFTEYGREWAGVAVRRLRAQISAASGPGPAADP